MNNLHNTQVYNQSLGHNTATLYVISPRIIPTQVIRPYVYNFNTDLVQSLKEESQLKHFFGANKPSRQKECTNRAILPTSQGTKLNTNELSMFWSFILIIDTGHTSGSKFALPNNKNRVIHTGFFLGEEPINPMTINNTTPTLNPNAIMQFTHSSTIFVNDKITARGSRQGQVNIAHDNECVSGVIDSMTSTDLYLMSPGDIRECTRGSSATGEMITTFADKSISSLSNRDVSVPTRLKSPKHQFQEIVYALDSAVENEHLESPLSAIRNGGYSDLHTEFVDVFDANLISESKFSPQTGIDIRKPISLKQLGNIYPNLVVLPFRIPTTSEWDVRPQDEVSIFNSMSSMVASTVGALATGAGLADVSFRYNSAMGGSLHPLGGGHWEIQYVPKTLVPMDEAGIKNCFNTLKNLLTFDLWPILQSVGGDFDVMINHSITGETLVGLQFLDLPESYGLYETCNRMGGMTMPVIGDVNTFNQNATELQHMVDEMAIASGVDDYYEAPDLYQHTSGDHHYQQSDTILPSSTDWNTGFNSDYDFFK